MKRRPDWRTTVELIERYLLAVLIVGSTLAALYSAAHWLTG
jgi:hypothetical protein